MRIKEFRQQYPQYNGFSDDTIARKLHAKHYSDVNYDEFATRFGVTKAPAQQVGVISEELVGIRKDIAAGKDVKMGKVEAPSFMQRLPGGFAGALTRPVELPQDTYIKELKKIYREPGTTEQREVKATARTRARLGERVSEIQAIVQDPITRRRIQENNQALKGKLLDKTYLRWERGEVMVVGGGLYLLDTLGSINPLRAIIPGVEEARETVSEWSRLMHKALQEPEMQPVIENAFDKYFGGAIETGPFLASAIGAAALTSGTSIPASVAGFLVAFGVEGNNILQTNLDQGRSERESRIRAFVGGTINGGIEIAGSGGAKYLKAARLSTVKKLGKARYFGKRVLHTALTEGLREEIPQELVSMVMGGDPPRNPDGSIDYAAIAMRLIDAGIMGTVIGGIADAPFSAYAITKLPSLPKGDVIDIGGGRFAVPGVVHTEANIISEESGNAVNPWIKQDVTASNKDRTLVIQSAEDEDISWMGEVNNTVPKTDVYIVKDITEAKIFLAKSGYGHIVFNATDATKEGVRELAKDFVGEISIGGPTDLKFFADLDNVKTHKTIQAMAEDRGLEYKSGTDLSHFESTQPDLTEAEIRTEIQTADEAIGAQSGLNPIQVQNKLAKAEERYRLLKHKDVDKRSKADKDELAFLSRHRSDIDAIIDDYTSDKPVVRDLWKKDKKPSKAELLRKGHQIPEQMNMTEEERMDLQEEVTRTETKAGKRSMAEMSKNELIKWVDYIETELAARGETYVDRPPVLSQLIERLETTAKIPISKMRSFLKKSRIGGLWTDLVRIERWLEALDGYEDGPLHQHIWKRIKQADELRNVNIGRDQTEFFRMIEDQNIDSALWCGAKETIREGLELTPFQQIGVYLLDQNKIGHKYLTEGMAVTDEDIALVGDKLTEEQLAVAAWLDEQYRSQWPIIRAIAISTGVDPKLLEQELNYSPILRTDLEEGEEVDFVSLLTDQFNTGSIKPEQGFLEKRQKRAIGEIELDAAMIYMKNIQRIETFKAMAPVAKDIGRIFNNRTFKKALNNATEKRGAKIMNTWLRDTVRGFMPGPLSEHAKQISIMRRHGIIYAIGYNVPSVFRQTLSLSNAMALDPLMVKYVPANMAVLAKRWGAFDEMQEFVDSKTNLRSTREYARDLVKKWDASALAKRLAGKKPFSEHATAWIKWTDNRTVTVAWKSLYDVAMEKTKGNEQAAIEFADQGITRTQPMANMKDLPHFFRGGTLERLLSTFQNQVNNNLNFYMHDIIGARIAGKISNTEVAYRVMFSYVLPAIAFGIIGRGGLPMDEGKISLKKLAIDLIAYPAGVLGVAGRIINRMIRGWGNSGTVGEIAPEEAIKIVQAMKRGDIGGIIKHAAATYGAATGKIPAQAIRTVGGAMDLAAGTTRDPRRLIYTQWALDQERAKKPVRRKGTPAGRR